MKEITTSNYSFENLRNGNTIYVDKTQYVWKLVSSSSMMYIEIASNKFFFEQKGHQLVAWKELTKSNLARKR